MPSADVNPSGPIGRDVAFTLPARLVLWGLVAKYVLLMAYGTVAILAGIPTFQLVAGPLLALIWPSAIALLAALSLAGVIRSWNTVNQDLELHATRALVAVFTAYSGALTFRWLTLADTGSAALAILPLVLLVFPALRILAIGIWRKEHLP